jgi:hypothetical protein
LIKGLGTPDQDRCPSTVPKRRSAQYFGAKFHLKTRPVKPEGTLCGQKSALIVADGLRGFRRIMGVGVQVPSSALSLLLSLCLNRVSVDTAILLNSSSLMT